MYNSARNTTEEEILSRILNADFTTNLSSHVKFKTLFRVVLFCLFVFLWLKYYGENE